jgi:hypothetical protein
MAKKEARKIGIAVDKLTGKTSSASAVARRAQVTDTKTGSKKSGVVKTNIKRDNQSLVARGKTPLKKYLTKKSK